MAANPREAADSLIAEGNRAESAGRLREACELYRKAVDAAPEYSKARLNLGIGLEAGGDAESAIGSYRAALALEPGNAYAGYNLGKLLYSRGDLEPAERLLRSALDSKPEFPEAHVVLSSVYDSQGNLQAAAAALEVALKQRPDYLGALSNYGTVLQKLGRSTEAEAALRRVIALDPGNVDAHSDLGNLLREKGKLSEAAASFRKALALRPDFPEAHFRLGSLLEGEGRVDEAIACYRKALALRPDFPEAHLYLGDALRGQDNLGEGLGHFQKALSLRPEYAEARWFLTMSQLPAVYEADTDPGVYRAAFSRELGALEGWVDASRLAKGVNAVGVHQPFYLAYQEENNRDLLERYGNLCARLMGEWFDRQDFAASAAKREPDGVIRIGIVSQHFRSHAVWLALVRGWFEQLDRRRFSLHAFYLGAEQDRDTLFAMSRASHFEQGAKEERQWVEAILAQRPDVLIYPEVGMVPTTLSLASLRLAPVQVATWGHPETTGLPTIDYYLSAEDLEPLDAQENYTERLVSLPHLGCFYKSPQVVAVDPDLRKLGIDPASRLLLCPGTPFKYAPQHDRVFTEIARRLGRCRFIFFTYKTRELTEKLRRRLETMFVRSGLNLDDFVTFIPWQNWPEFHGLLKRADVFLDTIGFSGFNSAMQAVECGLPIVTREGRFLRGRLASGVLKRLGLQELVAGSEEDYIALAVRLVEDGDYRKSVRDRIEAGRHVLFEDPAPIRALEDFLTRAVESAPAPRA